MLNQNSEELSDREREILRLVATGASNKDIAQKLFISPNTVKVHLRNIFAKIGVVSRTEAAMYAVKTKLVPTPLSDNESSQGQNSGDPSLFDNPDAAIDRSNAASFPQQTNLLVSQSEPDQQKRSLAKVYSLGWMIIALIFGGFLFVLTLTSIQNENPPATPSPSPTSIATTSSNSSALSLEGPEAGWQELMSLPITRSHLAASVYENFIYAIAGRTKEGTSGIVERFDLTNNAWEAVLSKPTPVSEISAAVVGGKIFVPGGKLADGRVTNILEIFDPIENTWAKGRSLPIAVSAYALAAHEGLIYLFGGWDGQGFINNTLMYDPRLDEWQSLKPMLTRRGFAGAVVSFSEIQVIGGTDGQSGLSVVEIFQPHGADAANGTWRMGIELPEDRYGMSVASMADFVYVFGGITDSAPNTTSYQLTPRSSSWQIASEWPYGALAYSGTAVTGTRVFILGGQVDETPSSKLLTIQTLYAVMVPTIR